MSVLDDTFTYFATKLQPRNVPVMAATLTGTKLSSLSGFVATAGNAQVTYVPGATPPNPPSNATIKFDATLVFQLDPGKNKGVTVTLSQIPPLSGGGYSMKIVLPWVTVDCVPNVDATSQVVYGSQADQFVTLVLNANQEVNPP